MDRPQKPAATLSARCRLLRPAARRRTSRATRHQVPTDQPAHRCPFLGQSRTLRRRLVPSTSSLLTTRDIWCRRERSHQDTFQTQSEYSKSGGTGCALTYRRSELQYILKVRQQPIAARACGFGERDRRVIDPPPIIQLEVRDPKTGLVVDLDELRYSLNVVHCTLWNAEGTHEETALIQPDRRTTRRLMGQLVASPCVAKDEHDVEGCFFCFPDLSCRTHGKYRLRFVLMRIDPQNLHVGGFSPILTEVLSDVFQVYTAKDFPGMRPSSALTRALKLQGCNIQVKKGNEKAFARKRASLSSDEGRTGAAATAGGAGGPADDDPNKKRRKKE